MELCVINCGTNGYASISKRLEKSLVDTGFTGDSIILAGSLPDGSQTHENNPYAFKIYAFENALKLGYKKILWLDSSFYAVKNIQPLSDYITENGFHFFKTGYNLAQSCNDRTLNFAGITRDEAEHITEYASGAVGFDFSKEICVNVYNYWKYLMQKGMFKGSRVHDNQSQDPRFLFHRQDQSCLTIAMHKYGMKMKEDTEFIAYFGGEYNHEKLLLFIRGI